MTTTDTLQARWRLLAERLQAPDGTRPLMMPKYYYSGRSDELEPSEPHLETLFEAAWKCGIMMFVATTPIGYALRVKAHAGDRGVTREGADLQNLPLDATNAVLEVLG